MSPFRQGLIFLACATLLVIAQLLLKRGITGFGQPNLTLAGGVRLIRYIATSPVLIAGYMIGFLAGLFWLSALSVVDLSFAAPVLMGTYFLELLLLSRLLLKESISPWRWLGALLILGGLLILARTGPGKPHDQPAISALEQIDTAAVRRRAAASEGDFMHTRQFKPLARKLPARIATALIGWPRPLPTAADKAKLIAETAARFGIRNFVETGTHAGDMVEAQRRNFDHVVSIELADVLFAHAQSRFTGVPNVRIIAGDSAEVLPSVIASMNGTALYWLDAHYSGGKTAKGEVPVIRELTAIGERNCPGDIVLIDDARLFPGHNGYSRLEAVIGKHRSYPSLQVLAAITRRCWKDHDISVADDIIRIGRISKDS
jgi:multidrug transporter EmrE-like cation transporter